MNFQLAVRQAQRTLHISIDDTFNTTSTLPSDLFDRITQLVFEKAIVEETVTTRNVLIDVDGILPLLQAVVDVQHNVTENEPDASPLQDDNGAQKPPADEGDEEPHGNTPPPPNPGNTNPARNNTENPTGGPRPGGPSPDHSLKQ